MLDALKKANANIDSKVLQADGGYKTALISGDSHIVEPDGLWRNTMPKDVEGVLPAQGVRLLTDKPMEQASRLAYQDQNQLSAEVLFPTRALEIFQVLDGRTQQIAFKVYNDWLADFCAYSRKRLFGVACIQTLDIGSACDEVGRAYDLGLVGALIGHKPDPSMPFMSGYYNRLWAAAVECDLPIVFHIGGPISSAAHCDAAEEINRKVNARESEASRAMFELLFSGALDKQRKLKVLFASGQAGWIPSILERWDAYFERARHSMGFLIKRRPSEIFAEQVSCTFGDEFESIALSPAFAHGNCLWSNDDPMQSACHPGFIKSPAYCTDLSLQARWRDMMRQNAINLFSLNAG